MRKKVSIVGAGNVGATPGPRSPAAVPAASNTSMLVDNRKLATESLLRVLERPAPTP